MLLLWQACPISQFITSNIWKSFLLQYICHKHLQICAISRPPVKGQEQQSTGYTLTGHRCNCKYSQLALLFNTAANGCQWSCKLHYSNCRKLQLSLCMLWWHTGGFIAPPILNLGTISSRMVIRKLQPFTSRDKPRYSWVGWLVGTTVTMELIHLSCRTNVNFITLGLIWDTCLWNTRQIVKGDTQEFPRPAACYIDWSTPTIYKHYNFFMSIMATMPSMFILPLWAVLIWMW